MPLLSRRAFVLTGIAALPVAANVPLLYAGADDFMDLRAEAATHPLMPDKSPVPVLGYNGLIPGPVIRARKGETVRIRFHNKLDESTTVHWHGIRIDNAMDGVPGMTQKPVEPGGTFDYVFTAPDAGTYWYHPHKSASQQLGRGLYGALIVDGDADHAFDDDLTLILDDWRLNEDGTISETFGNMMDASHAGRLGNWMTANGSSGLDIPVTAGNMTRLRLINSSNSRVLYLDLDSLGATVVALDGQPVAEPFSGSGRFALAPSQRADIAVVFSQEGTVPFRETSRDPFVFANLKVNPASRPIVAKPVTALVANTLSEPDVATATRYEMRLQGGMMGPAYEARIGTMDHETMDKTRTAHDLPVMDRRELAGLGMFWALSGVSGTDEKPFLSATAGEHVHITLVNETAWPHAMHFHGHHFRVLTRNGKREPGTPWRDTVLLDAEENVEIAFVADNPGKWMIHCHMIEHQISGMMSWMEVI